MTNKIKAGDIAYILPSSGVDQKLAQIIGPVVGDCVPILCPKKSGYLIGTPDVAQYNVDSKYLGRYFVRVPISHVLTTIPK